MATATAAVDRLIFKHCYCITNIMKRSTKNVIRKRPGRPATGHDPVTALRLPVELVKSVDAWASDRGITRSEAIRRSIDCGIADRWQAQGAGEAMEARNKPIGGYGRQDN